MDNMIDRDRALLDKVCTLYEKQAYICVNDIRSLKNIPETQGVYWIESTIPKPTLKRLINKRTNTKNNIITQVNNKFYTLYSGTERNIQQRLKEHLFNQGGDKSKLGCVVSDKDFSKYGWRVKFLEINSHSLRYATEIYWREKYGYPPFCIR